MSLETKIQGWALAVTAATLVLNCVATVFTVLTWNVDHVKASAQIVSAVGAHASPSAPSFLWVAGIMAITTASCAFLIWLLLRMFTLSRYGLRPKLTVEANWKPEPENLGKFNTSLARPLTLVNDSDSPAFNVTIRSITVGRYTANFASDSVVRRGKNVIANVRVEGFGALQQGDMHWMFEKEVNSRGTLDLEITVPIVVDYIDSDRTEFETEQSITYNVFTKTAVFALTYQGPRRKKKS